MDDVTLYLCNIPEYVDAAQSDNEFATDQQTLHKQSFDNAYTTFNEFNALQETDVSAGPFLFPTPVHWQQLYTVSKLTC